MARKTDPARLAADLIIRVQTQLGLTKSEGLPIPVAHALLTKVIATNDKALRKSIKSLRKSVAAAEQAHERRHYAESEVAAARQLMQALQNHYEPQRYQTGTPTHFETLDPSHWGVNLAKSQLPPPRNGHTPGFVRPPDPPPTFPPHHPEAS